MKQVELDSVDIRILAALQKHGRLSKAKLAEIVFLSPTPCWKRLKRLESLGVISGYFAEISLEKVSAITQFIVNVTLAEHQKPVFDRFEEFVCLQPEVIECVAVCGGVDYNMKVISKDIESFHTLMDEMLSKELNIKNYWVYMISRKIKCETPCVEFYAQDAN